MLRLASAAALLAATIQPLSAQDVEDDGSYNTFFSAGLGRFTGDYGEEEDTTLDVLSLTARRYFTRGEAQLSVPYLSVDGDGVRLVDDRPVAIPGGATPGGQDKESGLGDVVVRGEYYLRTGTSTSPWLIGLLRVKLPTGNEDRGLGTGATDVEAGLGWIRRHGPLNWLADVGYTFVGGSGGLDPKNVWRMGAGLSVPFGVDERNNTYVYLENRTNRFGDSDDRRSLAVGVGTALDEAKRLRVSASAFFGLSDTAEDWGLYLTLGHRH
jgi:Putative MetA-pathway of phenol degradation